MLAGLAAGWSVLGQKGNDPSLYIPKPQVVEDRSFLHEFMDKYSFVDVVTSTPAIRVTHIPVLLDRTSGPYGRILGHISRNNPQSETFDGSHACVVVFRGPHGYISPSWLANSDVVPTWNFAVVHASGHPKAIVDKKAIRSMLDALIDKFERNQNSGYALSKLPEAYVSNLMEGIVGFELRIESLEGKFKLGQGWSDIDRQRVLENLRREDRGESLYDLSAEFFRRSQAK